MSVVEGFYVTVTVGRQVVTKPLAIQTRQSIDQALLTKKSSRQHRNCKIKTFSLPEEPKSPANPDEPHSSGILTGTDANHSRGIRERDILLKTETVLQPQFVSSRGRCLQQKNTAESFMNVYFHPAFQYTQTRLSEDLSVGRSPRRHAKCRPGLPLARSQLKDCAY